MSSRKNSTSKKRSARRESTPLSRLRGSVEQVMRTRRLLASKFRSWSGSDHPQVAVGAEAVEELGRVAERLVAVATALEADKFVPPAAVQYKPPVEGEHVRIPPKYRSKYAEKCADQLRACPTLFDDLIISKVWSSSKSVLVGKSPYAPFEARKSHLVSVRRPA